MDGAAPTQSRRWLAFGGIALVSVWAAMPGLLGSWVGDDFHMLTSRYYGDWSAIPTVFTRHAGHYLSDEIAPGTAWPYRPITMLSLLLTHAVAPRPWLHHLLSWVLHLATGAFLYVALLRSTPSDEQSRSAQSVALALAALFVLHPVAVESYVWINGRSDLLAGFCLAALAAVLTSKRLGPAERAMLTAALGFLGAGSKLPFLVAAVALFVGIALRPEGRKLGWGAALSLVGGIGGYLVLRAAYASLFGRVGAAQSVFEPSTLVALPHLVAKSIASILSLRAEAMQSLAWELYQAPSLGEWLGAAAGVVAFVGFAWRRDFGGLALLTGFALTVAPCIVVSRAIWIGFDRYLYMPMILLAVALGPHLERWVDGLRPSAKRLTRVLAAALIVVAAISTRTASLAYVDQGAYERALLEAHPDDPTTVFYLARIAHRSGNPRKARETLAHIPEPPWPNALVMPAFALASELGDGRVRDLAIEHGLAAGLTDPVVRAHGMRWKYQRGEVEEALALARSFDGREPLCTEVRRQLDLWLRSAQKDKQRESLALALEEVRCSGPDR